MNMVKPNICICLTFTAIYLLLAQLRISRKKVCQQQNGGCTQARGGLQLP